MAKEYTEEFEEYELDEEEWYDETEEKRQKVSEFLLRFGSNLADILSGLAIGVRNFVSGFFRGLIFGDRDRQTLAESVSRAIQARNIGKGEKKNAIDFEGKNEPTREKSKDKTQDKTTDKAIVTIPEKEEDRIPCGKIEPQKHNPVSAKEFLENVEVQKILSELHLSGTVNSFEERRLRSIPCGEGTLAGEEDLILSVSDDLAISFTINTSDLLNGDATSLAEGLLWVEKMRGEIGDKREALDMAKVIEARSLLAVGRMRNSVLNLDTSKWNTLSYIYARSERGLEPSILRGCKESLEVQGVYNAKVRGVPVMEAMRSGNLAMALPGTFKHQLDKTEMVLDKGISVIHETDSILDKVFVKIEHDEREKTEIIPLEQFSAESLKTYACMPYFIETAFTESDKKEMMEKIEQFSDLSTHGTYKDGMLSFENGTKLPVLEENNLLKDYELPDVTQHENPYQSFYEPEEMMYPEEEIIYPNFPEEELEPEYTPVFNKEETRDYEEEYEIGDL